MISVAMATYNSEEYIEEQLDSIRIQTVPVDEVVFVDDCSSDRTVNILKAYINKYRLSNWIIHVHDNNKGYIQTFTDALRAASGEIIILCDHDDIWLPNKVELIKNEFKRQPDMLLLATSFTQINADGNDVSVKLKKNHANNNLIRRNVDKNKLNKMNLYDIAVYNISPGCTCAIKGTLRNLYLKEEHKLPHDWKLSIQAACLDGLYYLDIPTTKYRIHLNNTIGLGHQSHFKTRKEIIIRNCEEKKESSKIVAALKGFNSKEYLYYKGIEKVFEQRKSFMKELKFFEGVKALFTSFRYGKLYESVIMDFIAKVKT